MHTFITEIPYTEFRTQIITEFRGIRQCKIPILIRVSSSKPQTWHFTAKEQFMKKINKIKIK
jgi:hypothetical protein